MDVAKCVCHSQLVTKGSDRNSFWTTTGVRVYTSSALLWGGILLACLLAFLFSCLLACLLTVINMTFVMIVLIMIANFGSFYHSYFVFCGYPYDHLLIPFSYFYGFIVVDAHLVGG